MVVPESMTDQAIGAEELDQSPEDAHVVNRFEDGKSLVKQRFVARLCAVLSIPNSDSIEAIY